MVATTELLVETVRLHRATRPVAHAGARVPMPPASCRPRSGSGTTSLASRVAAARHGPWTPTIFWLPPIHPTATRAPLPGSHCVRGPCPIPRWVLSGRSVDGEIRHCRIDLVIFLSFPGGSTRALRRERGPLRGPSGAPGGARHRAASSPRMGGPYECGDIQMRSRALHEAWLAALPAPVLRLEAIGRSPNNCGESS